MCSAVCGKVLKQAAVTLPGSVRCSALCTLFCLTGICAAACAAPGSEWLPSLGWRPGRDHKTEEQLWQLIRQEASSDAVRTDGRLLCASLPA